MRFACEGCNAKYMISDDKVGPGGVKVRCKKCGHVTHVRKAEEAGAAAPGAGGIHAAEWWVAIDDQPVGPISLEVVQRHWDASEIHPESLVWYAGLAEWAPISDVPELYAFLAGGLPVGGTSQPPPAPPPAPAPAPAAEEPWRPGAASALAALEEPEPRPEAPAATGPALRELSPFDDLGDDAPAAPAEPTGSGRDPTGIQPLPMAGLERTGERRLQATPGLRGPGARATPVRSRKESRSLPAVLVVALVVVAAVAVGLWLLTK